MENKIFRQLHGAYYPDLLTLGQQRTAVVFANFEQLFEYSRPITHKLVYIGGIGRSQHKLLSNVWNHFCSNLINNFKNFITILENAPNGVVILSFGSNANCTLLPLHTKQSILTAFSNFPDLTFIWKYEQPNDYKVFGKTNKYVNVHPFEWIPQIELLSMYSKMSL
jgi:hypothetical protein